ncbi:MAG TPA: hypothetical protein VMY39_04860, partial [Planctomycetota bacterium]|nr:hypothetical protein [Planctomycetota bacterium]
MKTSGRAAIVLLSLAALAVTASAEEGYETDPKPLAEAPAVYAPIARVPVTPDGIMPDERAVDSGLFIRVRQPVAKARVPFTVTEPSGVARKRCPVRGAIPIYRGELKDPTKIRLVDDAGGEIPVQGLATSVWPEGTVKFLCIDFLTDLDAGQTRTFTLEYGLQVTPRADTRLKATKPGESVTVDTGMMAVSFAPGEGFIEKVTVNGRPATREGIGGGLAVSEGKPETPAKAYLPITDAVEIVENGPVQTTVHIAGSYGREMSATGLGWEKNVRRYPVHLFVRVYAGSARMDIVHSFGYNGDENRDFVRRCQMIVPLATPGGTFTYGGDGGAARVVPMAGNIHLVQPGQASWQLTGPVPAEGKRFGGWVSVQAPTATCVIGLRDAWQQWPAGFQADGARGELTVDLYGGVGAQFLDLRYKGEGFERKTGTAGFHKSKSMYTGDAYSTKYSSGAAHRAMGLLKISELVIDFTPDADPAAVGNGHHQPLVPWPGRKRYSDTRVLGLTGWYHDDDARLARAKDYF